MNRRNRLCAAAPPRNPPHRPDWSSEVCIFIISLAIPVICFLISSYKQAYSRQDSAGIVSEVFHFPESFVRDYERVERDLKVYIYPDRDPGGYFQSPTELTGIYGSEAYFFKNIKESRFLTTDPLQAHLFFIPISWHQMRTQGTHCEKMISIVENYVESIISKYPYWNRTQGADHFFVICHEIGVKVAEGVQFLKKNPIRLVCPATHDAHSIPFKDIPLPQVNQSFSHAIDERMKSGFCARIPNSEIRATLETLWENDSEPDIQNDLMFTADGYLLFHHKVYGTKFCICPHGFPADTALIADSIRYGCVPVIFSSYLNFPFNDVLDWHQFSIILAEEDVHLLKDTLEGIQGANFTRFQNNLLKVQKHFEWNSPPLRFDAFHMVLFDLWLRQFYQPESLLEIFLLYPGKLLMVSAAISMCIMACMCKFVLNLP